MPAKKSPEPFDDSDIVLDDEPLSLAMRMELGVAQPYGNIRYLAQFLEAPAEFPVLGAEQPGLSFKCPICRHGAKVTVSSRGVGPFAVECEGLCTPEAVSAVVSQLAPFAFTQRDDLVQAFPEGLAEQVIACAEENAYIPGHGNGHKLVRKLCGGAARVIPYCYTGPAGQVAAITFRVDRRGQKKTHPQVHCTLNSFGAIELTKGLPPGPWPIFHWHELVQRPADPALVSEGEKAATRAHRRFPECVSVTSLCGALNAHKTDWTPLAPCSDVIIWPDNDEPGLRYARSVAAHAIAAGSKRVRIVVLPKGLPEGWDLGDDLPDGITEEDLRKAIADAPEVKWDDVKQALRSTRDGREIPPFRLPDGHFRRRKKVFAAVEEALKHLDPGCHRALWLKILRAIYHALGGDGLALAIAWSRRENERHRKFEEGEVERLFEMFKLNPEPRPMSLRDLFWQAYRESAEREEDGKGWRPDPAVMAEAEVAAFESGTRKLVLGNNVFVGIQEQLPDGSYRIERKSEKVAESLYMSRRVFDFTGEKKVSIYKLWELHQRIPPLKLVFRPGETVGPDELNTFTGFQIKPVKGAGSYTLFRQLISRICSENGDEAEWLWNAIAYRLQFPNRLLGSAFALVGPQGSGKTTVTRTLAILHAPYSIRISEPERFVGRNNASLEGKLFVQAEEMVLGRREDYGHKLNNYITNDIIDVEEKYRAQAQVENRLWIGMTSNSEAVVSVGPGTRRFAMYRVSDAFKGDEEKRSEHFGALIAELESGGYEALMYDLLNWEIPASFNPRNVPKTPLYRELVGAAVDRDTMRTWWQEFLEKGQFEGTKSAEQPWTAPIRKDNLYAAYTGWCDRFTPASRAAVLSYAEWAKRLGRMLPGGLRTSRARRKENGGHFVHLPPYKECCDHFDAIFNVQLDRAPEPAQLKSVM